MAAEQLLCGPDMPAPLGVGYGLVMRDAEGLEVVPMVPTAGQIAGATARLDVVDLEGDGRTPRQPRMVEAGTGLAEIHAGKQEVLKDTLNTNRRPAERAAVMVTAKGGLPGISPHV